MRVVAARAADNYLVLHYQRSRRDAASALVGIVDIHAPQLVPGLLIDCYQETVGRPQENFAVAHRESAIDAESLATRSPGVGRQRIFVAPDQSARRRIQREHLRVRRGGVHHAIDHDGRGLQTVAVVACLERPRDRKILNVACVDLIERAVAPCKLRSAVMRPIRLGRSLRGGRQREQDQPKSHGVIIMQCIIMHEPENAARVIQFRRSCIRIFSRHPW